MPKPGLSVPMPPSTAISCFATAYDILFAAGWDEILAKFEALKSPIVFGTERYCWPKQEQAELYPPCPFKTRFLNAGMWMATSEYA